MELSELKYNIENNLLDSDCLVLKLEADKECNATSTFISPSANCDIIQNILLFAIGAITNAYDYSVAIGSSAEAGNNGIAIGKSANGGESSIVLGYEASTNSQSYCIVIGRSASAVSEGCTAIGRESYSYFQSIAIGDSARAESSYSIQLGNGSNYNESTLQVWDHTLLNKETGLIPPERLGTGYDSSQRQVLVNNYGTLTWETYNG